jgi:hypothetical protein
LSLSAIWYFVFVPNVSFYYVLAFAGVLTTTSAHMTETTSDAFLGNYITVFRNHTLIKAEGGEREIPTCCLHQYVRIPIAGDKFN